MAGLLVMTLAMLPIGMTSSLQQLFTLICLFYIGSIIAEPARETLGASLADARARGSYMGFSVWGSPSAARWVTRAAAGCLMPGKPSASPNCRG
ncbi:multidrug resistance protein MdtH [Klebsiella pneumoniae subsp. pneumoniae]|uniref:Multidrug resistance protein MdtH n=1 Tax=Klebsiella pneumoniae subsp. pneumoniae TaxID=72407 RepID=A0A377ZZU0_KLEPN|nr:multidrug resistance protein MdtH [Klebsiella pneumoniae subsp. pneumoniae]